MIAEEKKMSTDFALPEAFLERMRNLLTEGEYAAFLSSYGQKRRYSLRFNPLKGDRKTQIQLLQGGEKVLSQVPWEPDGFYYPEEFRPGRLPWHEAGMYYIQEASAMAPAMLCGVQPGERVLDLCAAPGGKSTKLAACLRGEGILVANEIHPERAKVLSANLERMGVRNALVTNETPQHLASRFPIFFDRIVVDAPCSGEGMFRKEEEALLHWSPENVRMCAERQAEILEEAASMLRSGGIMVYSTCTFSPEENEGVIYHFLMTHKDFTALNISDIPGIRAEEWSFACGRPEWIPDLEGEEENCSEDGTKDRFVDVLQQVRGTLRLWPHLLSGEGHFAAVLRKDGMQSAAADALAGTDAWADIRERRTQADNAGKEERRKKKEKGKNSTQRSRKRNNGDLSLKEAQYMWEEFCRDNLISADAPDAVTAISEDRLCMFGNTLFALPAPASQISLSGLRVLRAGMELGTVVKSRFEPSHALAMALRMKEVCRCIELEGDSPMAYAWLRGESVSMNGTAEKGWTLVQIDGCSAGWGKANNGILKNHYPKGIRKGSNYTKEYRKEK